MSTQVETLNYGSRLPALMACAALGRTLVTTELEVSKTRPIPEFQP